MNIMVRQSRKSGVASPEIIIVEMARNDGTYKKVPAKYANPIPLIIDEWLLLKPTEYSGCFGATVSVFLEQRYYRTRIFKSKNE